MSTSLTKALLRTESVAIAAYDRGAREKGSGASLDFSPSAPMAGMASWQDQQAYAEQYSLMREWVYSAINALASEGAGQPPVVARLSGSKVKPQGKKLHELKRMTKTARQKTANTEYEIQEDHFLVDLLEHPNEFQEKWQFVYSFFANLVLTGMAYVTVGYSKRLKKLELYSLPSTWVKPNHKKGLFTQFEVKNPNAVGAEPTMLDRTQVGFAMLPNPSDPLAVLAPASSQLRTLRMYEHMLNGQEAFLRNSAFPSVIVSMAQGPYQSTKGRPVLTNVQRRMIHHALRQNVMGDMNQGTAFIVDGLIEDMKPFSVKHRDMGWEKTEETLKTRILSAFGVHSFILGEFMPGSQAQAEIIEGRFYKRVNTYLDMLSTLLTNLLGAIEGDEKLLIWFEECQASNPERRTTTFLAMRASGDIGQNEMRAEMGLPPDEDLNQAVIQASSMAGITQILTLLGQGSIQREQAVATFVGMGVPTDVAENIAGVGLPEPEPPAPPELPKPPAGEEDEPEEEKPEEGEEDEAVEELKLANLLLAKAMEPPEQQADRLLKSVERSWTSQPRVPAGSPSGGEWGPEGGSWSGGGGEWVKPKPESKPKPEPSSDISDKIEREQSRTRSSSAAKMADEELVSSRGELTKAERKEVAAYTADAPLGKHPNYLRVNSEIRQGKSLSQVTPPPNSSALQELASRKLGKPTILYRGMKEGMIESLMGKKPKVGTEIKMKGFVSTTLNPQVSAKFARNGGAVMEIRAKTGLPVSDASKFKGEREVVQAHGIKYRYVGKGEKKVKGADVYMFEEV